MGRPSSAARALGIAITLSVGCGEGIGHGERGPAVRGVFTVRGVHDLRDATFFDHPFPSDLRRADDGSASFEGISTTGGPLVSAYVEATRGLLRGFSPAAAITVRFDGPIDPTSLPASPPASLASDATVQLIDCDERSPERGARRLLETRWRAEATRYEPENTLAVRPMLGRPLRPGTRYALLVTRALRADGGGEVLPAATLEALLQPARADAPEDEELAEARRLLEPALTELAAAGIAREAIAHLTVFTTDDPTRETFAAMDDVLANTAAPDARDWRFIDDRASFELYEGTYGPSPVYQTGSAPYRRPEDGGGFVVAAGDRGSPEVQGSFDLRFALAVPHRDACPEPASGYPVVLYAHGTGGDYRSFVSDGTAAALGGACLASMGIDQIFHGTRPGASAPGPTAETSTQLAFFNLDNVLAARTNNRQAAVDLVQQARLFTEGRATIPADVARGGAAITFDGARVLFFGHSQGGLNGPLFLAGTSLARGGVLSGAACDLGLNLLEKTKPVDVAALFRVLSGAGEGELDRFHPVVTLVQSIVDVADPLHYAEAITRAPRPGHAPKSVLMTEGVRPDGSGDSYAPPRGIETLAVAIGLPRALPGVRAIPETAWAGLPDVAVSPEGLTANLAGGRASGALVQITPPSGRDGHFVAFDVAAARAMTTAFLASLAEAPPGRVPPLAD